MQGTFEALSDEKYTQGEIIGKSYLSWKKGSK